MAWTNIIAFTLDKVFGYQSANQLRDNINALAAAPYIVKSANAPNDFLTGAQGLDVLATGYVKNTTGSGVLTTVPTVPMADIPANIKRANIYFHIANFASAGAGIATGVAGFWVVPWAGDISQVTLLSIDPDVTSGSIVVDIWKDSYTNFPPTVADSICASAKPTLTSGIKYQDAVLTGWNKTLAPGDVLGFNVDSVATVKHILVELRVTLT